MILITHDIDISKHKLMGSWQLYSIAGLDIAIEYRLEINP